MTSDLPSFQRMALPYEPNGRLLGILQVCTQTGNFLHAGIMAVVVEGRRRWDLVTYSTLTRRWCLCCLYSSATIQYTASLVSIAGRSSFPRPAISPLSARFEGCYFLFDRVNSMSVSFCYFTSMQDERTFFPPNKALVEILWKDKK